MRIFNFWIKLKLCGFITQLLPVFLIAQPPQMPEDMHHVQRLLYNNELILEYFITDSSAQITAIDHESVLVTKQSLDKLFWFSLRSFQKKLQAAESNDFVMHGELMYLYLIKPVQSLLSGKRRLIIIPGERMSRLPFEAFICSDSLVVANKTLNLKYLIHDYEVVYHNSLDCWTEQAMAENLVNLNEADSNRCVFMGFSPEFENNEQVNSLPGAKSEIMEIGALFRQKGLLSKLVCGEQSGKDCFKSMVEKGRIIHLATHHILQKAGNEAGGFAFKGYDPTNEKSHPQVGLLTTDEIQLLKLHADLIVLNSCASGFGQKMGSSDCSLGQILLDAGARNILSTLWNVTDNLAGDFMIDFYRAVLSGKSYSESLREVKLKWISCAATSIPTIWAPYVLMGK
jgi:CHAT domain-containing protein